MDRACPGAVSLLYCMGDQDIQGRSATGAAASRPTKLRFRDVTFDPSSGEIARKGVRVRLQDHSRGILELLAAHPGEMVDRERLIAHLWPRTTYIDTDAGLNTAIKRLRAALGDDADAPLFIETVPRRGYRFIASVSPDTGPEQGPEAATRRWPRRALTGLALLTAGLLVAFGLRFLPGNPVARVANPGAAVQLPDRNVAVLPFTNLTGDPHREHLALALSESLLHRLADVREINVIARTSSFAFQGRYEDVREIGRKLDARYLVEGSLQDSSTRLRVTTQLIDAATGAHVWSKTFDRPRDDFFATQDEIALEVARALKQSVGGFDIRSPRPIGTANFDAWLAYEQGRARGSSRLTGDLHAAVALLERAVRLDPEFAAARAELANAYLNEASFAPPRDVATAKASQMAAARAAPLVNPALDRDSGDSAAQLVRGRIANIEGDVAGADAAFRRAIELNPNDARGYQYLGELLIDNRRSIKEGLAAIERARLLDPLDPRGPYYAGLVEFFRGDVAAGERLMIETLKLRPDYAPALARLGWSSARRGGRLADAVKLGEQALRIDPESQWLRGYLLSWYLDLGDAEAARSLLVQHVPDRGMAIELYFYERQYDRAAALIYARPEEFERCGVDPDALLEHARATGNVARAQQFLQERVSLWNRDGEATVEPDNEQVAVVMAWLLENSGRMREARQLLEAPAARETRTRPPDSLLCTGAVRARALAALGRNHEAVAALRRDMLERGDWENGWYTFDRDPLFTRLRTDPGFGHVRNAYRKHIAEEKAKLDDMRTRGLVPERSLHSDSR